MDDEKNEQKGHETRPGEEEQKGQTQQANGTLAVRVFGSQKHGDSDVISGAVVTVRREYGPEPAITGVTDDAGEFVRELPSGMWNVEARAYNLSPFNSPVEIRPKCQTDIPVAWSIDLQVQTAAVGDAERRSDPRFYPAGTIIAASVAYFPSDVQMGDVEFEWTVSGGDVFESEAAGKEIHVVASGQSRRVDLTVAAVGGAGERMSASAFAMMAPTPAVTVGGSLDVGLRRAASVVTPDLPLWIVIQNSTGGLSFKNYCHFINVVLCDTPSDELFDGIEAKRIFAKRKEFGELQNRRFLPFCDSDAYRLLKVATEAFVMVNCGVALTSYPPFAQSDFDTLVGRTGVNGLGMERFKELWNCYLEKVNGTKIRTLPYLALVASKFPDARIKSRVLQSLSPGAITELCNGILEQKLSAPCLVELIWSYWHEEAMLVQTLNAISMRFQNRRTRHGDPLANMEIASLRPLNNLLWGYIQDEQHRLTVLRRGYEYDHHYGLRLEGRAVQDFRTADSRGQFLPAFHNLLHLSSVFFQKDDNTMVNADAFPVLNSLKEVHLILSQGAHNQFGDLPVTARVEMLMQQWILARTEFADFLPTRAMVAYPEPWMDRVDAMKKVQGWSEVNVLHFRDLGVFGEKLLLTIRYGSWVDVSDPDQAKNWLRAWRPEIQGYIHAYRAVTGVDVTTEPVNATLPSVLLQQRLAQQSRPRAY